MNVGGQAIDAAVAEAFLAALSPAAVQACLAAADQLEAGYDAALDQHRLQIDADTGAFAIDRRGLARGRPLEWRHTVIRGSA
jgi:hypothetical protein